MHTGDVASLGHVAVGLLAARVHGADTPRQTATLMVGLAGMAILPDVDVFGVAMGLADSGPLGHRGFTHSLPFALFVAAVVGLCVRRAGFRGLHTGTFVFLAIASHGLLDAMTYGSRGVPLLWPLSDVRLASPWRPIPSAPTGLAFLSMRGLEVAAVEAIYFGPLLLLALWPRPRVAPRATVSWLAARGVGVTLAVTVCLTLAQLVLRDTWLIARLEGASSIVLSDRGASARRYAPGTAASAR
jgi:inner membrane protein